MKYCDHDLPDTLNGNSAPTRAFLETSKSVIGSDSRASIGRPVS